MTGKKVLLVPLNWGLGHATRLIPVINMLLNKGAEVYIAGSPEHISLFTREFDNLKITDLPYFRIKLNNSKSQIFNLFCHLPFFLIQIFLEHRALKKLLIRQHIDIVISDNCYGLWNRKIYSIFITHQVSIKLPQSIRYLGKPINKINHWFIDKYNICWVPDFEKEFSLAGELSHSATHKSNILYIGPLSRFANNEKHLNYPGEIKRNQILFIISGPEVQRTIFENKIKSQIEHLKSDYTSIVVRGLPSDKENNLPHGWFNHFPGKELESLILQSEFIVCRPGYSTIMDLVFLQKKALVIPTPGQTEQEYLAKYSETNGLFYSQQQDKLNISAGIEKLRTNREKISYPLFSSDILNSLLEKPPFNR